MQKNTIYFFIIFIFGIIVNNLVLNKSCDDYNYRKCKKRCNHKGVKECEQKHGKLTECRCRHR